MRILCLGLVAALSILATDAEAAQRARRSPASASAPACDEPKRGITMQINQTTGYSPSLGGINGSCSGGASAHRGFAACQNTLQSFITGKTKFFQAATQQKNGSSAMFGCWAVSNEVLTNRGIPQGENACAVISMTDRYAKSESIGRVGASGKTITEAKIDIEVSRLDANYRKLSKRAPASFSCVKRAFGVQNKDHKIKAFRNRRRA
jgi:hypothetical protein